MELNIGNKQIEQLFAEFFGLDSSYIHQCYRKLKDSYNQKLSSSHEGFIPKQKQSLKISFQEKQTQNHLENSPLIGIDLPLFFNSLDPKAQIVMLVAEDPQRSRKDFSLELKDDFGAKLFKPEDAIIGTPFALHSSYYKERRTKQYWHPIKHIIEKNYHLYITDKYKVFMLDYKNTIKPKKYDLKQEDAIFEELLLKEIEIIKPNKIICFGGKAYKSCKKLLRDNDCKSKLLPALPHPSGANRNWNHMFKEGDLVENKIKYIKTKIDEYLD